MVEFKQFYTDAQTLYDKYRDNHPDEDWEQMFFDAMEDKYNNAHQMCLIHLYYADDDGLSEVASGILNDLVGEELLMAAVLEDESRDTTIAVMLIKRNDNE